MTIYDSDAKKSEHVVAGAGTQAVFSKGKGFEPKVKIFLFENGFVCRAEWPHLLCRMAQLNCIIRGSPSGWAIFVSF